MTASESAYAIFLRSAIADEADDNIDVDVVFADGRRYAATFATPANLATLLRRYRATGECLSGT